MSKNMIKCPNCGLNLERDDVEFSLAARGYPYFDVTCRPCGHKWEAHHGDWFPNPRNRNPANITPRL